MNKVRIISVDFQKDFTSKEGFVYKPRPSVDFIRKTLIPFFRKNNIKISEIISDYREIPLSSRGYFCIPGQEGFRSEIPDDLKNKNVWIKCAHSPIWTRENIGIANKKPSKPYQDPRAFSKWAESNIGKPEDNNEIIIIGLTVNCCVLSLAQELYSRGYKVKILEESTDDYLGGAAEKKNALKLIEVNRWADVITWKELEKKLKKS